MPKIRSIILGKLILVAARIRGGGSAFPGLIIEKTDRGFIYDCLSELPKGVVVVSGTNGKTTTTKIVVKLLESQGLKVFTNHTGSNLLRGIIAELIRDISFSGKIDADIAVLELDEAHATHFINILPPKYSLLLNVYEDQTERFSCADQTALLLARIADKTTGYIITSRDDPRLSAIEAETDIVYFGAAPELAQEFYSKSSLDSNKLPSALVELKEHNDEYSEYTINGKDYCVSLSLNGIYNSLNAAAALTLIKTILPDSDTEKLMLVLKSIQPAAGRGEVFNINGMSIQLLLVKNSAGFNLALSSFDLSCHDNMIATNNALADGQDISWLSDVDFCALKNSGVAVVSGSCAEEVSEHLAIQNVAVNNIDINLTSAINRFIKTSNRPKRIFCSYTAMVVIRKHLTKLM